MRVLIVNTSECTGGAAVAARRLMTALNKNGVKAKMLVRDKETDDITVATLPHPWRQRWRFLWERWCIFCHLRFRRSHLFDVDTAHTGADITRLPEFREADIIHLHWINQGMLSLKDIRKILKSGKPVVWTMHDMWPATAICHLTLGCNRFKSTCTHCKYLPGHAAHDLAWRTWQRKKATLARHSIFFVACSKWLAEEARQSSLLTRQAIENIPNPIDTHLFHPEDQQEARQRTSLPTDKHLILFVSQRATNVNKGMTFLADAVRQLANERPATRTDTAVVVLGGHAEEVAPLFDLPVHALGYVSDPKQIADIYNAADVFVLPSLSENLPNTIMEAMACGTPCVAFNVGGIPEMIDHRQNGYVARYRDSADLKNGLLWTVFQNNHDTLAAACVKKVAGHYSERAVAMKYISVYHRAQALKTYHL